MCENFSKTQNIHPKKWIWYNAAYLIFRGVFFGFFFCVQIAGRGRGCGEAVYPESLFEEFVKGSKYQIQSDDLLLPKTSGATISTNAGPSRLCFSLLLSYAGWGNMYSLGLENFICRITVPNYMILRHYKYWKEFICAHNWLYLL